MAVGSPFLNSLGLDRYGLSWRWAEIDCAHPLDGGDAGLLYRSVEDTAAGLGADGARWRLMFGRPSAEYDKLAADIMRPAAASAPPSAGLARFGLPTLLPGSAFARVLATEKGRALFGGVAAHAFRPLHYPLTSAIGVGIITAGHRRGWPVAAGGSGSITAALASLLADLGGKIETGVRIEAASQLPPADVTLFDLAPDVVAAVLGDRLPVAGRRAYRRFRRAPGAFKVDFAVEGGVPWANPDVGRAGTVHFGGGFAEIAATERDDQRRADAGTAVRTGRPAVPRRPAAVGRRRPPGVQPTRTCRMATPATPPRRSSRRSNGSPRDSGSGSSARRPAARRPSPPVNPNFAGGDIITGAKDARQLVFGPALRSSPYPPGIPGIYLCSAATPPGPGAHGMCGANAAREALRYLRRQGKA